MSDIIERLLNPTTFCCIQPTHLHSPDYTKGKALLKEATTEIAALRDIICRSANAIGNGAAISTECSIEFMSHLPDEIATHTAALREQYLQSQTDLQNAIGDRDEAIKQQIRAEARAETAERKLVEARGGLSAAIRAAKLAVFTINKQGVMPNSSWKCGFETDLKTAEEAARAIMEE